MPTVPQDTSYEQIYKKEHNPHYLVVKSNEIVQNSHYTLSLLDLKVLGGLISHIKPGQKSLTVRFSTSEFVKMLGLTDSGTNFGNIMSAVKGLADKSFYLLGRDKKYHLLRWIDEVTADPNGHGKGDFCVTFKPYMRGYLFAQSMKYRTIYPISDILMMRSSYSIQLYELFRSNASRQPRKKYGLNYSINELKYNLNLMYRRNNGKGKIWRNKKHQIRYKYPRFADFNRRVLKPAIKEINYLTECNIKVRKLRHHRKVTGINVVIRKKNKAQRRKSDDRYYFMSKGIPRSKWGAYRRKLRYGSSDTHIQKRKEEIYKIEHFGEKPPKKLSDKDVTVGSVHVHPFQTRHHSSTTIEFYSPFVKKFITTSHQEMKKQYELYEQTKKIKENYKSSK